MVQQQKAGKIQSMEMETIQ